MNPEQTESEGKRQVSRSTYAFGIAAILISSYLILWAIISAATSYYSLESAIARGDIQSMRRIIAKGADVNALNRSRDRTMLGCACEYGLYDKKLWTRREFKQQRIREMLEILIDNGANVNAPDPFGYTPLYLVTRMDYARHPASSAAVQEHKRLVAMLLTKGADVNTKHPASGCTPLHNLVAVSVESENFEIVKLLLESGADPNMKDTNGETPLSLAILKKDRKIAELLRKYGAME